MIAAIRVRGVPGVEGGTRSALERLGLDRMNSCVLLPDNDSTRGQLQKVKDYVTWGDLDREGAELLLDRADVSSRRTLADADLEEVTGYTSREELAQDLAEGDASLNDADLRHVVRLHSPRKGYKNTKQVYPDGSLGDRGDDINDLIRRMR